MDSAAAAWNKLKAERDSLRTELEQTKKERGNLCAEAAHSWKRVEELREHIVQLKKERDDWQTDHALLNDDHKHLARDLDNMIIRLDQAAALLRDAWYLISDEWGSDCEDAQDIVKFLAGQLAGPPVTDEPGLPDCIIG